MSVEVWLAFVAASAILLIIPGPAILTVIGYSVAHGRRANVPLVTAVALGDSTALVLSLLGLGALLATSAFWFTVIQWTGGLYLVYLGIKLLRAGISASKIAAPTTMRPIVYSILACLALLAGCTAAPQRASMADLQKQVVAAERWFAKSLADRNHVAFMTFLSDEAIFFTGPTPLRGKQAVADVWKRFYEKPEAPFSWEPETVQVLDSGTLALSSGPVRDPNGKHFATFSSIWRLEAPGVWQVIFDKGNEVCDCAKP